MGDGTAPEPQPWTIARLLGWTADFLARRQVDGPRLSAEVLLAHVLACRRIDLYARFDRTPGEAERARFRELVAKAAEHTPVAYLVGKKEFFSLEFSVTPDVLIPRPETETLVEAVLDHCRAYSLETPSILDVGTGSGCIAVALLTQLPAARMVATDISPAALAVARQNAERHHVADRLLLVEADRLDLAASTVPEGGFDVIASNPPYVAVEDWGRLDACVRDHEPRVALTDGGTGLSFYTAMAGAAPAVLAPGGMVFVEVAAGQAGAARGVFAAAGGWVHKATIRDRVQGHDRVVAFARS